jgi:hypothetical protein
MKKLIALSVAFVLLSVAFKKATYAQSDENRIKMQLIINYGDKLISTDLNSVSTSLTRSYDEQATVPAVKDTAKIKVPAGYAGAFYIVVDAKKVSDELLRAFAKKQTRFDGTITIVDSYGKNPPRTIKFKKANLYSFSDQMSSASYGDAYGASSISLNCQEISINGITIEQ